MRTMDCIDCHTRPSHSYKLPERAVDESLAKGQMDASLPYVRKIALQVIKVDYQTTTESEREIPKRFMAYYQNAYPAIWQTRRAAVESTAKAVMAGLCRQRLPRDEGVKWGAYANNIGHTDYTGCFPLPRRACGQQGQQDNPDGLRHVPQEAGGGRRVPQDPDGTRPGTGHRRLELDPLTRGR